MDISPLDIKQKQFKLKFRGFDISEVDSFLEEVTEQVEALMKENESLRQNNASLSAQLAQMRETENTLRDTLLAAQKISDEMKAGAEREAKLKLKEAELEAEKMLRDARHRLAATQEEITELNRIKERFALKVRGVIEDHLKMLTYEEREEGPK